MSEAVHIFPDGREVCNDDTKAGRYEYVLRTMQMAHRQGWTCALCPASFRDDPASATFDHEGGRGMGGSKRDDRLEVDGRWRNAALCMTCNGAKGSKRYRWVNGRYQPVRKVA